MSHGDWISLLRASESEVEAPIELHPPPGPTTTFPFATFEWASQWPTQELRKARKRG